MIVTTDTGSAAVILGPDGERTRVRCLARRDMLHSACTSFDHIRLSPGAHYEAPGRAGSEAAWYVLRGPLVAEQLPGRPTFLAAGGDLLLVPPGLDLHLCAGPLGAELLCLTLAPIPLPTPTVRRPAVPPRRRAGHAGRSTRP